MHPVPAITTPTLPACKSGARRIAPQRLPTLHADGALLDAAKSHTALFEKIQFINLVLQLILESALSSPSSNTASLRLFAGVARCVRRRAAQGPVQHEDGSGVNGIVQHAPIAVCLQIGGNYGTGALKLEGKTDYGAGLVDAHLIIPFTRTNKLCWFASGGLFIFCRKAQVNYCYQ